MRWSHHLGISIDLPDIPIDRTAAAVPAAHAFHDIDETVVHLAASPKRLRVDSAGMAAETTGYLDVMPGPKVTHTYPVTALGKNDNVPFLFHFGMLEA